MLQFKILYSFSSQDLDLVETKRTDLPEGAPLSDIYKWLAIQKEKITELSFKSMGRVDESTELRQFHQGELKFNESIGEFIFEGKTFHLTRKNPEEKSASLTVLIESHLSNSSHIIKRLKAENLEIFRELNQVFARAFMDSETHLSKIPSDQYLKEWLGKDHVIVLASFAQDKVIGGLVAYVLQKYEQERSEIYIYDLAVDLPHRRQGIARALINHLKTIAKTYSAWAIFVQADKVDTPAVKLYESMGIKEEPFHFDIYI